MRQKARLDVAYAAGARRNQQQSTPYLIALVSVGATGELAPKMPRRTMLGKGDEHGKGAQVLAVGFSSGFF